MSQQHIFHSDASANATSCDFATWARDYSQHTNRSLAGSRFILTKTLDSGSTGCAFEQVAQEWGMNIVRADSPEDHNDFTAHVESPAVEPDLQTSSGKQAMDLAQQHMPVLKKLVDQLSHEHDMRQLRVAMCLILEPKTAILARLLVQAGAQVGIYSGPETLNTRVAQQLESEGVTVYANPAWNPEEAKQAALTLLDTLKPNLIIDDGASFARLAARERPELAATLIGVAEETTSGVRAFDAMEIDQVLPFPVVAVNDSLMKTGFDNAHGTGETCITTIQQLLGAHCFQDTALTVIGFGPVGRGFARRARTLGAQVTICDTDPRACLQAVFEGFPTRDLKDTLPAADMVISATGVYHTVNLTHMHSMRDGTILGVIGGIANEIALDNIPQKCSQMNEPVSELHIPHGPHLTLLAGGNGINYTAGGGNPIEIMDLSFAVQVAALKWLLENYRTLDKKVYRLPDLVDRQIALTALSSRGYEISHSEDNTSNNWQVTRFDQPNGTQY